MNYKKKATSANKDDCSDDDLPEGWSLAWSRSKQKIYYCNRKLGVSQWSKPTPLDEIEILHVLSQMDLPNKARNTMIRNARKRLKEREELVSAKDSNLDTSIDNGEKNTFSLELKKESKYSSQHHFHPTFSVFCEGGDGKKKLKIDVPLQKDPDSDNKTESQKLASKRSPVKFTLRKDKTSKVVKVKRKDTLVQKAFTEKLLKTDEFQQKIQKHHKQKHKNIEIHHKQKHKNIEIHHKQKGKETEIHHNKEEDGDLPCGLLHLSSEASLPVCDKLKKHATEEYKSTECELDLTERTPQLKDITSKEISHKESADEQEEDMEYETSPEEHARVLNDINEIRVNFSDRDMADSPELTSAFFSDKFNHVDILQALQDSLLKVLYIVTDTNVLLNWNRFLIKLEKIYVRDYTRIHLVIPWIVMTELDLIKDNKKKLVSKDTQLMARSAVTYLHGHLQKKDGFILGQTPSEACKKHRKLEIISSNDDKILQCCIQWKEKYPDSDVVLLTGDTHLRNKAFILEIPAYTKETLEKWLKEIQASEHLGMNTEKYQKPATSQITFDNQCKDQQQNQLLQDNATEFNRPHEFCSVTHESFIRSHASSICDMSQSEDRMVDNFSQSRNGSDQPMDAEHFVTKVSESVLLIPDPMCHSSILSCSTSQKMHSAAKHSKTFERFKFVLQTGLGSLLEHHMKEVYGELWTSIIYKKPPWSLEDILQCLKRHWIAVFGDILGRSNLSELEQFISKLNEFKESAYSELLMIVKDAYHLLYGFKKHMSNNSLDETVISLQKIETLLDRAIKQDLSPNDVSELMNSDTVPEDTQCSYAVQSAFQEIWLKMHEILDAIRQKLSENQLTSDWKHIVSQFAEFCALVAFIHKNYSEMLSQAAQGSHDLSVFSALIGSLTTFAKHHSMTEWHEPTSEQMSRFIAMAEGRTILKNGFLQLENLMSALCQCNVYLSPEECQSVQTAINQALVS